MAADYNPDDYSYEDGRKKVRFKPGSAGGTPRKSVLDEFKAKQAASDAKKASAKNTDGKISKATAETMQAAQDMVLDKFRKAAPSYGPRGPVLEPPKEQPLPEWNRSHPPIRVTEPNTNPGQSQDVSPPGFAVIAHSETEVRVIISSLAGALPSGFSQDDDPIFILPIFSGQYVVAHVQCNSLGSVTVREIIAADEVEATTRTDFYTPIALITNAGAVLVPVQIQYGPIGWPHTNLTQLIDCDPEIDEDCDPETSLKPGPAVFASLGFSVPAARTLYSSDESVIVTEEGTAIDFTVSPDYTGCTAAITEITSNAIGYLTLKTQDGLYQIGLIPIELTVDPSGAVTGCGGTKNIIITDDTEILTDITYEDLEFCDEYGDTVIKRVLTLPIA